MPGKGPLPKVAGQRQRRNKRGELQLVPQLKKPPAVRPKWLRQTKDAWLDYWSSPISNAVDRRTDGQAVYRLFTLLDLRERAYRSYERKPFIDGSQGQKIVNPQASLMLRMDGELRLLGQELGLSPAARLRLGAEFGKDDNKDDDLSKAWHADDVEETKDPRRIKVMS